MTIVPVPLPAPNNGLYVFDDPAAGSKLNVPSHAELHTKINTAAENLHARVTDAETRINSVWTEVDKARLASHQWVIRGDLGGAEVRGYLLQPIIWNMTGRTVLYWAARATVYGPPSGSGLTVEIVTGHDLDGALWNAGMATSILKAPMTIPSGGYTSPQVGTLGFKDNTFHTDGNYVAAVITNVGSTNPGTDITIQLDRLL